MWHPLIYFALATISPTLQLILWPFRTLKWHFSLLFNPLSPGINIQILLTGLHTFHWVLIGRTCLNIKTIHLWWSFPQFSWPLCVIMQLIWWGEIWCWSLLGLKELIYCEPGEGTSLFGLNGYVPLNRVWFSGSYVLKQGIRFHCLASWTGCLSRLEALNPTCGYQHYFEI